MANARGIEDILQDNEGNLSNPEILKKAVIVAGDLATGGELSPIQADKFIDEIYNQSNLVGKARTERFDAKSMQIDKINLNNRVLVPNTQGVDPGVRNGVQTSKITLTPSNVMAPLEITDNFLNFNIEGKSIADRVVSFFGKQIANNIEELALYGDTNGPTQVQNAIVNTSGASSTQHIKDPLLSLFDGWIRLGDQGYIYDALNSSDYQALFTHGKKMMPSQHKTDPSKLRFMMPIDLEDNYRHVLGTRQTVLGDAARTGNIALTSLGVPLLALPLFQTRSRVVELITLTGTDAIPLRYTDILEEEVWITPEDTDSENPVTPYALTTDFTVQEEAGTITRVGGGNIASGATVRVTYLAPPQMILTRPENLIVAIGRDGMKVEKERNIYKQTWGFAISMRVDVKIQDLTALVKIINIKDEVVES